MTDYEQLIADFEHEVNKAHGEGWDFVDLSIEEGKEILALLKEQESEWLEDSDPGQEYGTTWACRKCGYSIHKPSIWNPYEFGYEYCLHCGRKMEKELPTERSPRV